MQIIFHQISVPSRINFTIGETEIRNIFQQEQKFLRKLLFPTCKLSDLFNYIKSEFETKLTNINALLIRDEYKVWIYIPYFIPSIRFLLTVHTISQNHLKKLATFTDKFVKKKMDWITSLCNKCCSTLETWPRHHFNVHPVQNNYDASIHQDKNTG